MNLTDQLATKPQILLPLVPQTYYGSSVSIENLKVGTKIYIGASNRVEEVIVNQIDFDEIGYKLHTDSAIYLVTPNTRLQYCSSHK